MKNNQKKLKNGKKSYLYIIFLALAFIILLGTGAYAYYQTNITGTISGSVAKWSFKANNQTSNFNIDFGSLYPGKYAEYNLELSAEDSELPVAFELIFHYAVVSNGFSEAGYNVLSHAFKIGNSSNTLGTAVGLKGLIMPGEKATIPIIFDWPYGDAYYEGDADFYVQLADTGKDITFPITIVGRQVDISNMENFQYSALGSDLLGLSQLSGCSNGTYGYPNKYGYPCALEFSMLSGNDYEFLGEKTIGFTFNDGTSIELPDYLAAILGVN